MIVPPSSSGQTASKMAQSSTSHPHSLIT
jgi:hypothetical protein